MDTILSPVGAEEPTRHILSINDALFNVAIELQSIILIGASVKSVNSEYRNINANARSLMSVINGKSTNAPVNKFFKRLIQVVDKAVTGGALTYKSDQIKAVTKQALAFALAYYLILRKANYPAEYFDTLNNSKEVNTLRLVFDHVLVKTKITAIELNEFESFITAFDNIKTGIGSKLLYLTDRQIRATTDLTYMIWKALYIQRILGNLPNTKHLILPLLDWGVVQGPTKRLFTNPEIIETLSFGEHIQHIRSMNNNQSELLTTLKGCSQLTKIKKLTQEMADASSGIDHALTDISLITFYPDAGITLMDAINEYISAAKGKPPAQTPVASSLFENHNVFQRFVFQYLYAVFLLATQGIMHNDPHFRNILVSKAPHTTKKSYFDITSMFSIEMAPFDVNLTIIDFNKAILAPDHRDDFAKDAAIIANEMKVAFSEKNHIHDDPYQIFNCYVMYDVIKFSLLMKMMLIRISDSVGRRAPATVFKKHTEFLNDIIKRAIDILYRIYDPKPKLNIKDRAASMRELISVVYMLNMVPKDKKDKKENKMSFVSARRKHAELLKKAYISQYVSTNKP